MLNLAQIKQTVKSADLSRVQFNPNSPLWINDNYRRLKGLGWQCVNREMHPDRVPVFRLGEASIRRDKAQPGAWIVEIGPDVYHATGQVEEITAEVADLLASQAAASEPLPAQLTPAQQVALELKTAHPELAARIDKALALCEAGRIEFPEYETSYSDTTSPVTRYCSCPDARYRGHHVLGIGVACKHTLAGLIADRVQQQQATTAARKFADKWELARAREQGQASQQPAVDGEEPSILDLLDYDEPAARAQALPAWAGRRRQSLEDWLK